MRWVAAPLAALFLFLGAGFVSALSRTTEASAVLAKSADEAPSSTREGVEQTAGLPQIAELTGRQADAFDRLVIALRRTAHQVQLLNGSLKQQSSGLVAVRESLGRLRAPVTCSGEALGRLLDSSDDVPPLLTQARSRIASLMEQQEGSLRHMRSINRKLMAFEAFAEITSAEPLPPPGPLRWDPPRARGAGGAGATC